MFNLFKSLKKKRENKRQTKRLAQISSVFGTMERLAKSGLLHWDRRRRRLFIAEPLAAVMLAKGARCWSNFLNNTYQYVAYIHMIDLWERQLSTRQNRAVAEARRTRPVLSSSEIQRLKRGVITEMSEEDVSMPNVESFEFYVIADSTDSKVETTLCGTYDPDTDYIDMVLWEDVQDAVSAFHKKKNS